MRQMRAETHEGHDHGSESVGSSLSGDSAILRDPPDTDSEPIQGGLCIGVKASICHELELAAVSLLVRYSGRSHHLYSFQLREWFAWCQRNGLDPLVGVQRAHVELYIRSL